MKDPDRQEKAIEDFKTAIKFSRGNPIPSLKFAKALAHLGQEKEALQQLQETYERAPWHKTASLHLAAFLACAKDQNLRDGEVAEKVALKATKAEWDKGWWPMRILAASQAEAGNFSDAIVTQKKIIADGKFSVSLKSLQEDLKRYEEKKRLDRSPVELLGYFQSVEDHRGEREPIQVDNGLVAMWNFDESVNESLKNRETTVLGDATIVEGKVRGALSLGQPEEDNRLDSYDVSSVINRTSSHSVAFWVLPKNERGMIFASGKDRDATLQVGSSEQRVYVKISGKELLSVSAKTPNVTLPVDQWTHVVYSYNGKSEKPYFKLYVNGEPVMFNHFLFRNARMELSDTRLQIGAACGEISAGGMLDELRIYDRELTTEEAKTIMEYAR